MMPLLEALFWIFAACVAYAYIGYPLILASVARLRPYRRTGASLRTAAPWPVAVIVAAHNEEWCIGRRVRELAEIIAARGAGGEVIVVSDGSTDRTVGIVRAVATDLMAQLGTAAGIAIEIIALPTNMGKAVALNHGCSAAAQPFLVLADARQTWAPDAIHRLLANFGDPSVGAVSGDLILESAPGVMAGVGLYWRFEKWLRQTESALYSMVSVTGSICAEAGALPTHPGRDSP